MQAKRLILFALVGFICVAFLSGCFGGGGVSTKYTLATSVVGEGSIARNPDRSEYQANTKVELTAVPDPGWEFVEWAGSITGTANPAIVTVDGNLAVVAVFQPSWLGRPQLLTSTIAYGDPSPLVVSIAINKSPEELAASAKFDLSAAAPGTVYLKIVVTDANGAAYEVLFPVDVVVTDEQAMQQIKDIHELADQRIDLMGDDPSLSVPEMLDRLADELRQHSAVSSVEVESGSLEITYVSGLSSFIFIDEAGTPGGGSRNGTPVIPIEQQTQGRNAVDITDVGLHRWMYTGYDHVSRTVLVWAPFEWQVKGYVEHGMALSIVDRFEDSQLGFTVVSLVDEQATVSSLKSITDFGMVMLITHGARGRWITTGEHQTDDRDKEYKAHISARRMTVGTVYERPGGIRKGGTFYMVNNEFLEREVIGTFQDSIIVNCSCESTKTDRLWRFFSDNGAAVYFGWSESVRIVFAPGPVYRLVERLRDGDVTALEAYSPAVDPYLDARWEMLGDGAVAFAKGLSNGDFENGLHGWQSIGDGRVIYDTFYISISTADGRVEELLFKTVDDIASGFFAQHQELDSPNYGELCGGLVSVSPEIRFDQGDVWMTDWKRSTFDITQFQGQVVTLTLGTTDIGDSVYDTAVLIDNIRGE